MTQREADADQPGELELFLTQIRYEGRNIHSYEFVDPDGGELPLFSAGAHIDIHLAGGLVRQYSLCNSPTERRRYVIAVLRDAKGRGGSQSLHERLRVQDRVRVSRPRNNFELHPAARKTVLLAGGIGITPLKAMAHALREQGADCELHYCARDAGAAAFGGELDALLESGRLHLHFDNGDPARGLDIAGLLHGAPPAGTHLFYCGPAGFMDACAKAAAHWPAGTVHCEHFKAPERVPDAAAPEGGFRIEIASTGQCLAVPADRSIADVLKDAGIGLATSCEAGLCATCKVRYLSGEVDHRDYVLDAADQQDYLTVCVSRARSELLVLDL
ncbi:Phthalate dioxygenase reductase [Achromobacter anxifer]|uniref:PDR/VanB family oxidoreductase n=1 Tax=Achromobacter anxifer TaxID=1287737 RepID=UPI00155C6ED7|nr:PDR/VanB family oxidoreductase [Achromobacter anxifer]CAB5513777.1 Phthalate dioxygenase reductase [Achromobacter anxifer]